MSTYTSFSILPDGTTDITVHIHRTGNPITAISIGPGPKLTPLFDHIRDELSKAMTAPTTIVAFAEEAPGSPTVVVDVIPASEGHAHTMPAASVEPGSTGTAGGGGASPDDTDVVHRNLHLCLAVDPGDDYEVGSGGGCCERPAGHTGSHRCATDGGFIAWSDCTATDGGHTCELAAGHDGQHVARTGPTSLMFWGDL